jgi:hypothetical protein
MDEPRVDGLSAATVHEADGIRGSDQDPSGDGQLNAPRRNRESSLESFGRSG